MLLHIEQWPETNILLVQKLFKWLMVLFIGELDTETEYLVWDLFFVKGSIVIFRVALTLLQLMEVQILQAATFNEVVTVITTFAQTQVTRKILLQNLVSGIDFKEICRLRNEFRDQVLNDLQQEMSYANGMQVNRKQFLKKFILFDAIDKQTAESEFQCSQDWPVCLYDFTIKSKCPNFFVYRVFNPLDSHIIDDYFYASDLAISGSYKPNEQTLEHRQLLIERNYHLCKGIFESCFKQQLAKEEPKLLQNHIFNMLFAQELLQEHARDQFIKEVTENSSESYFVAELIKRNSESHQVDDAYLPVTSSSSVINKAQLSYNKLNQSKLNQSQYLQEQLNTTELSLLQLAVRHSINLSQHQLTSSQNLGLISKQNVQSSYFDQGQPINLSASQKVFSPVTLQFKRESFISDSQQRQPKESMIIVGVSEDESYGEEDCCPWEQLSEPDQNNECLLDVSRYTFVNQLR